MYKIANQSINLKKQKLLPKFKQAERQILSICCQAVYGNYMVVAIDSIKCDQDASNLTFCSILVTASIDDEKAEDI